MRQSGNIEDRRGASPGGFGMGGLGGGGFGGGGIRMGGGMGLGGLVLVVLIAWLFGANPLSLLSPDSGEIANEPVTPGLSPNADEASQMVSRVLGDTEDAWTATFRSEGMSYPQPTLVLFADEVGSACGSASSATGPFYCPAIARCTSTRAFSATWIGASGLPEILLRPTSSPMKWAITSRTY
jgi:predicted metalloprotease